MSATAPFPANPMPPQSKHVLLGMPTCHRCGAGFYNQRTFGFRQQLCPPCKRALNVRLTVRPEASETEAVSR
jgi:hypothetical protein